MVKLIVYCRNTGLRSWGATLSVPPAGGWPGTNGSEKVSGQCLRAEQRKTVPVSRISAERGICNAIHFHSRFGVGVEQAWGSARLLIRQM